ncbi:HprK-related kinase B [Methyloprofundus sp.]|uniref:HprK-related kinase B n=1 Tax=Methyloprofundus sp. TaxID=2020875 RepID=UPI003D0D43B5
MTSNTQVHDLSAELMQGIPLLKQCLFLQCGNCVISLQSNSSPLLEELQHYFKHLVITQTTADISIIAIESAPLKLSYSFKDWPREASKNGRKDTYYSLEGGRLIYKVRTGMIFLQSKNSRIAAGPCEQNPNQVINFINSQHMSWLQQREWLICHAAAVAYKNRAYAIAGFSGGGKSTFMLHLMDNEKIDFISNDRLFIRASDKQVNATGIAKLPRINPGTIVNNPRLHALIPEQQRLQLLSLPKQQLWDIEEKYDVDIEVLYGQGRIIDANPLQAFIVLNWKHESEQDFQVNKVDLTQRRDLLAAIMKSPGPFYQDTQGKFLDEHAEFNEPAYLAILDQLIIYEVSGKIDFSALQAYFMQNIINETDS